MNQNHDRDSTSEQPNATGNPERSGGASDENPVPQGFPADAFATRMGVHYPTGYALIALADDDAVQRFSQGLAQAGFSDDTLIPVPGSVLQDFLDRTLQQAGMLAQIIASELKQSRIFVQLAQHGGHFLLVRVADDGARNRLIEVGTRQGSYKAVYYQMLAIEELAFSSEQFPGSSPYGANERPRQKTMHRPT